MSAIDVLRSFAESRSADHELVLDGITYRHCREACAEIARLRKAVEVRDSRSLTEDYDTWECDYCGGDWCHKSGCPIVTHPLEPPKDPGQLPDDGPGGDHEAD